MLLLISILGLPIIIAFYIPNVGVGTAGLGNANYNTVCESLRAGFTLIDTAQAPEWYVEREVGRAIRSPSCYSYDNQSEDVFIVTKVHPRSFSETKFKKAIDQSLLNLRKDDEFEVRKLDAVLIHAPYCWRGHCSREEEQYTWQNAWKLLIDYQKNGLIGLIGVSNFDIHLLQELKRSGSKLPDIVQNWLDPFHQDFEVREFCKAYGIIYMAYSSFGTQWHSRPTNPVLSSYALRAIAHTHSVSVTDVVLAYLRQLKVVAIPRSSKVEHIRHNAEYLSGGITLNDDEMQIIAGLDGTLGDPW